jgi:hypothetical protein
MADDRSNSAQSGFLRVGREDLPKISPQQRTILVRKGNELFNGGKIAQAQRIFLSVGYTDGILRLGDHYYENKKPLEAFRMYWLARDQYRTELMAERMAAVLRIWLQDDSEQEGKTIE